MSQHNVKPIENYWKAVIYLLRYLKGIKSRGISYTNSNLIPFGYSDSSWANNLFDQKSTAGYLLIFNGGPILEASCKQPTVSISTCEIEYIVQTKAIYEVVWIHGLLRKLGVLETIEEDRYLKTVLFPTPFFANN